jgi:CelD/BcsL family acetyltransferase involved in cellulose biosynthesis
MIEILDSIAPVAGEWDALVDRVGAPPFVRPGWFAAWWRAFGSGPRVLVTARADGRLVGVVPLQRRGSGVTSPTNAHSPGFSVVAENAEAAGELADSVLELPGRRLQLDHMDAGDPAAEHIHRRALALGRRVVRWKMRRSPYLAFTDPEEDVDRRLPRTVAANLRRRERRLGEQGRLEVHIADGRQGLDSLLDEGIRLEGSGWKVARGTAIESSPATRSFYTAVSAWAAHQGMLRLVFLRLDGRALAFQLGLEDRGVYYFVKGGYDPAMRNYGPGKLLARAMIARAAEAGLDRFEFLGADEPWKLEWSPRFHERMLLRIFPGSALGTVDGAAQSAYLRYARPLAKRAVEHLR